MEKTLLNIDHLSVALDTPAGTVQAVRDVSLTLHEGEVLALVGESGCGKSMLCRSIMKLLPKNAMITGGSITVNEVDITGYRERDMRRLRGRVFSMIFQDPLTALDPAMPVGQQIAEAVRAHMGRMARGDVDSRVEELLAPALLAIKSIPVASFIILALILFSLIAILIGGMGIFAFAIFMVESKTREIALRKVNGASERQIMLLFNRQFMTKVLVACVIGLPIAYYASRKWLENYAYRIEIQPWIFVLTIVISLCIVLLVTNWQIRQASRNNPIDTLKTE